MVVRQATPDDWQSIQALNKQIFEFELTIEPSSNLDFPHSDEAIAYFRKAAAAEDDHVAFVYEEDARIVGYLIAKLIPGKDVTHRVGIRLAQLHTLCVDESYRRRGIAKRLMEAGQEWAIASGANKLKIVAYAGNARARSLYSSMGFREFEVGYEMDLLHDRA